jgi:hypothetical protein
MQYKESSWKDKVDPAFDKFIKLYLEVLEKMKLPGNKGYLALDLDEKNFKKMEIGGFPSIASLYEHDKPDDVILDYALLFSDAPLSKSDLNVIKREFKKSGNYFEALLLAVDEIEDEESREYYSRSFKFLRSENNCKELISGLDKIGIKKAGKKFHSDVLSLTWQCAMEDVKSLKENIDEKRPIIEKRAHSQPRMLRRSIFFVWDTVSLLVNKKSLKELFNEARNEVRKGTGESLFKLIKIDKTLFDHDWVRARIRKAIYSGDWKFFDLLSKAIKTDPLENRKVHGDIFLILLFFWRLGLYRLTIPELMTLFKESGVRMIYDEINFRKFVDREIKPLFKDWLPIQKLDI